MAISYSKCDIFTVYFVKDQCYSWFQSTTCNQKRDIKQREFSDKEFQGKGGLVQRLSDWLFYICAVILLLGLWTACKMKKGIQSNGVLGGEGGWVQPLPFGYLLLLGIILLHRLWGLQGIAKQCWVLTLIKIEAM